MQVPGNGLGLQWLTYWHSPKAKNSVHQLAYELFDRKVGESTVVHCTLDCDNLLDPDYLEGMLQHFDHMAQALGA